jgi:hypothetical protein
MSSIDFLACQFKTDLALWGSAQDAATSPGLRATILYFNSLLEAFTNAFNISRTLLPLPVPKLKM